LAFVAFSVKKKHLKQPPELKKVSNQRSRAIPNKLSLGKNKQRKKNFLESPTPTEGFISFLGAGAGGHHD